jgi:hypothetical protein
MTILIKNQYLIFATRISWADFNDIERKFKNSSEPYLDQLFLTKKDASYTKILSRTESKLLNNYQIHTSSVLHLKNKNYNIQLNMMFDIPAQN